MHHAHAPDPGRPATRNRYHAKTKLEMKDLYGKHAFFWLVHALGCIIAEIREGIFEPDASRHLRMPPGHRNKDLQKYFAPSGTDPDAITTQIGSATALPTGMESASQPTIALLSAEPTTASIQAFQEQARHRRPSAWHPKPAPTDMGDPESLVPA